jgi:uncharacterized protein
MTASGANAGVGDDVRDAIDSGDIARLCGLLGGHPSAAEQPFRWDDGRGGGDRTQPIHYVSLARFHARADHDRMGEIAVLLLAAGAPPEGPPDAAETPVVTAASYDEPGVAAALLDAGADPVGRGFAAPGATALAHAVFFGNPAVADVLVDAGAPITTLAEAAGNGRLVDPLALAEANPTERAAALRAAAVCQHLHVIDHLLACGTAVDTDVEDGATALHVAAFHGKPDAVRYLVGRGADPARRDEVHRATPLDFARFRHRELFRPSPGHDAVEAWLAEL